MSTLAPSSPPPSVVCLAHLHLELSFIVLQLLPFLIIVIAVGGLADHAEEAGVANVEVVVSAEGAPPVLERHSQDFVHAGPLQAHKPGLPNHLQLNHAPLLVVVRSLEVHWHILCLAQKMTDDKEDNDNLRHHWYILCLARVLTRYFALRWYFFRITSKLSSAMGRES